MASSLKSDPYKVGRQLEVVLAQHKSDPKTKEARKKKKAVDKFAASVGGKATEVATVEEREQLAKEYQALRAEMGLPKSKEGRML